MELHTLYREFAVAHTHDLAVLGFGGDFQARGQRRAEYGERMVARRDERARQSAKHSEARMPYVRSFSVDHLARTADLASVSLADCLVSQAHSQDGNPARKF